jgi:3-phosphoshikimate 1-carboxyvinyltransferase
MKTTVQPAVQPLRGSLHIPGDKSISHRALLFGALASGTSRIHGMLSTGDCLATQSCLAQLGVTIEPNIDGTVLVRGVGLQGLSQPTTDIHCGRSGTTLRLLAGILAGQSFPSVLTGDRQLLRRPMARIVNPLREMNSTIKATNGCAPLRIAGAKLQGAVHDLAIASAQVKSALLLAGLYADGDTTVHQCGPARDHTERMLAAMGAKVQVDGLSVSIEPTTALSPLELRVPGDISSAAFPIVAAILVPGSKITLRHVGLNPTRTGLLDVLMAMGADIEIANRSTDSGEPVGDITVTSSHLTATTVEGHTVVRMIDEFPILAVAACYAQGTTIIHGASELRAKETDRIATVASELRALGAQIGEYQDGFAIHGPTPLHGGIVDSHRDHRLAMALTIAGLVAQNDVIVDQAEYAADSYPGFLEQIHLLGVRQ